MAANYTTTGSQRTIRVLSPTQILEVERVDAETIPHGVTFWAYIPLLEFMTLAGDAQLDQLATAIEGLISSGGASAAAMIEDTDANGLIQDLVRFTLEVPGPAATGGTFSTQVDVPVTTLTDSEGFIRPNAATLIADGFAALNHLAGL